MLEDEADTALVSRDIGHILSMEQDAAVAGISEFQPGDDAQQGGLAGAGRTEQRGQ
jgi:hypothetical protein